MAVCCAVFFAQCLAFLTSLSSALSMCDTPVISSGNYSTGKYEMDSLNLDCSASSADNIFWFYRPPGNDSKWEPYKFSWCSEQSPKTCHLDDNDKRLRIGSVSMEMNDAQFICVASCSTTLRNATAFIYLGVQECYTKRPEVMPGQNVSASLTREATLSCQAQMGPCYQLTDPNYIWINEDNQRFVTNENYTVNVTLDGQGSLVASLTIHEVKQEDFKSYTCILIDDHFIEGSVRTTIYLLQTESVIINSEVSGQVVCIVVPCVVFLFIVLTIAIIIYRYFRWRLKYTYKIKWSKRKSGGAQYDAIVWYDNNRKEEARTLIDTLEGKRYRIVTQEEGPSGLEMKSLENLIKNSACVIFLRGDDGKTMTVLRQAQEKQTVFVIDTTDPSEERNKAMAGFIRLRWPVKKGQATRTCIFAKLREDEFYYRLRLGLPEPNPVPDESETIPMRPNVEQQI